MPCFHIAGAGWGIICLMNGAHSVLLREVDLEAILRDIPKYGVTHAVYVPAVLQLLVGIPGVENTDFSSLDTILYGASPISEDVLVKSIEVFGCRFLQAYGLTETDGAVVLLPPEDHDVGGPNAHRLRAAGLPMPGVELKVVDNDGKECAVGDVGEVWIRSPSNMDGYWNMPEATAASMTPDGWFLSGDAGYLDADGYLYIHDRIKDMIISGGENIYPAEVESALMGHPAVADVAVIGVPDETWGEAVKAVVVRVPYADVTAHELMSFSRERLAHYKCPTSVDWTEVLPRNPSGKIVKTDLREPYWKGEERRVH
jgi:long-chain acyl-CoA synthetase